MVKIGVSGLGRIGRMLVRHLISDGYHLSVMYEPLMDVKQAAYLLNTDSLHRKSAPEPAVSAQGDQLIIDGKPCRYVYSTNFDPALFYDLDLLVECSGRKDHVEKLQTYKDKRLPRIVLTWANTIDVPMIIRGVNQSGNSWKQHRVISAGSCTGHCVLPVLNVLKKNFPLESCIFNVLHPYLSSQSLLDNPSRGPDPSYWRAAPLSVIPADTGLQNSISRVFPAIAEKCRVICYRVPVPVVLTIDANFIFSRPVKKEDIVTVVKEEIRENPASGLTIVSELRVSQDFVDTPWSAAVDISRLAPESTIQKLILWQDNEWGYARRVADLIADYLSE